MTDMPAQLVALTRAQGGVFIARQAIACGLSYPALDRLRRSGRIVRLRRGAYATRTVAEQDPGPKGRHRLLMRAGLLALTPPAWLSHQSAAVLHGLDLYDVDLSVVHVTRPGHLSSRVDAGIDHHCGELPVHHRTVAGGLPVVSVARAVLDVARTHSFTQAVVTADSALRAGVGRDDLLEALDFCRDWPGAFTAGQVIPFADGRAESVGESLTRCVLALAGIPPDELQLVLPVGPHGARVDAAWRRWRVVLEFDGKVKYGRDLAPGGDPSEAAWRERQRELAIERLGWVVVRVTWADVVYRPEIVVARVREAMALAVSRGLVAQAG